MRYVYRRWTALVKASVGREKRGEGLRRRIASHLRGTFGFTSEQLVQFGVNPHPRVTRRKKPVETPAPAAK